MYLQALKLSTPSCFSSNFVLVVILHGTKQKYDQNSKNELTSRCSLLRRVAWWSSFVKIPLETGKTPTLGFG
jgi:hypothetical protein